MLRPDRIYRTGVIEPFDRRYDISRGISRGWMEWTVGPTAPSPYGTTPGQVATSISRGAQGRIPPGQAGKVYGKAVPLSPSAMPAVVTPTPSTPPAPTLPKAPALPAMPRTPAAPVPPRAPVTTPQTNVPAYKPVTVQVTMPGRATPMTTSSVPPAFAKVAQTPSVAKMQAAAAQPAKGIFERIIDAIKAPFMAESKTVKPIMAAAPSTKATTLNVGPTSQIAQSKTTNATAAIKSSGALGYCCGCGLAGNVRML